MKLQIFIVKYFLLRILVSEWCFGKIQAIKNVRFDRHCNYDASISLFAHFFSCKVHF